MQKGLLRKKVLMISVVMLSVEVLSSQCNIQDRFREFPVIYRQESDGIYYVRSLQRDAQLYDFIFQSLEKRCGNKIKIMVFTCDDDIGKPCQEIVYETIHDLKDMKNLYLSQFSDQNNPFVVRLDLAGLANKGIVDTESENPDTRFRLQINTSSDNGASWSVLYDSRNKSYFRFEPYVSQ